MITRGRGEDYQKKQKEYKEKFESLDLDNLVRKIYFSSLKQATEDYKIEIENNRRHFLEVSYTEEQAQERFNNYTNNIRIQNEQDDCLYRLIKNQVIKENLESSIEDLKEYIIGILCSFLKSDDLSYSNKLELIEVLPEEIYTSEKTQKQFDFFKDFAEKYMNHSAVKSNVSRTHIAYYCYYTSQTNTLKTENPFPSVNAWQEIGKSYGKNWKNIQKVYNAIFKNRLERLKRSRVKTIETVIEKLLINNDKALKLAKDELNMAKLNS